LNSEPPVIGWRIKQQLRSDHERCVPAVPVARPVALSIAPPRELVRRHLTALADDFTGLCRKISTMDAIENRPACRDHTAAAFAPLFPVERGQGNAVALEQRRVGVVCAKLNQYRGISNITAVRATAELCSVRATFVTISFLWIDTAPGEKEPKTRAGWWPMAMMNGR
jgi:hypothetical protein